VPCKGIQLKGIWLSLDCFKRHWLEQSILTAPPLTGSGVRWDMVSTCLKQGCISSSELQLARLHFPVPKPGPVSTS
jgi:hypothetical protein